LFEKVEPLNHPAYQIARFGSCELMLLRYAQENLVWLILSIDLPHVFRGVG